VESTKSAVLFLTPAPLPQCWVKTNTKLRTPVLKDHLTRAAFLDPFFPGAPLAAKELSAAEASGAGVLSPVNALAKSASGLGCSSGFLGEAPQR